MDIDDRRHVEPRKATQNVLRQRPDVRFVADQVSEMRERARRIDEGFLYNELTHGEKNDADRTKQMDPKIPLLWRYYNVVAPLLRRAIRKRYGYELAGTIYHAARPVYARLIAEAPQIGAGNPMAKNIYLCFVPFALYVAAEGELTPEMFKTCIADLVDALPVDLIARIHHLSDGTFVSWLAIVDGEIVGTSGLSIVEKPPYFGCPTGKIGLISSMYVVPRFRRQGIARDLLLRVADDAKSAGCGVVQITASDAGVGLYGSCGFTHNRNFMQLVL